MLELFILYLIIRKNVSQPIGSFLDGVLAFSNGNSEARLDDTRQDELGKFASAFNHMASAVSARTRELELHKENLEELVRARTQDLEGAQSELLRKERLATLGQLTATVSHELRNPLGAMRPSLFLIAKKSDTTDHKLMNAIERLDRNIDRCDHIIDELLDFTRARVLESKELSIDSWLSEILKEQSITPGIDVEFRPGMSDAVVQFDDDRLRRALINVIDNACHAMTSETTGKVKENSRLIISTRKSNGRLEIIVSDNGEGISGEILPHIFEPLFSTKGFGVGLGMPTIKQIMQQHDGDIEIHSEFGKGTTATLWIPLNHGVESVA
jgi:signal transduction histidine kinase